MARSHEGHGLLALALGEALRSASAPFRRLLRGGPRRGPQPQRILFAPQDLRTSDPTVADDMASGFFVLGGHALDVAGSPFAVAAAPSAWAEALHAFGWLRHLRHAHDTRARETARALVADAFGRGGRTFERGPGRATHVTARRVIALLCGSSLVLTGADHAFYTRYLARIGKDVALLERDVLVGPIPSRLLAATALCYAALCCSGIENRLRRATRVLSYELDRRILPDGGHVSRNPATLVEILLDLLPLRLLFASRGVEVPEALAGAIGRIFPHLRELRHGSGELALFNGMGATPVDHLASLFANSSRGAAALPDERPSGYARLEAGGTLVLVDAGSAPPVPFSTAASAGTGSVEVSSGAARLIVNRGAPREEEARRLSRGTPAHSTLGVGEESAAAFLSEASGPLGRWLAGRLGPVVVGRPSAAATRSCDAAGEALTIRHDGYGPAFGVEHERRLVLGADGRLEGEDRLLPAAGTARVPSDIAVRFHLHPSVAVGPEGERGAIRLVDRDGTGWRFSVRSGEITVEPGLYCGGLDRARPTSTIVVRPEIDVFHGATALGWTLARLPAGDAPEAPQG